MPVLAKWREALWGERSTQIHRIRRVPSFRVDLAREMLPKPRMPTTATKLQVRQRDGFFCRFCGIRVVEASVRARVRSKYPSALRWGTKNVEQHAAFQCMWLQYDHVLPNSRGGESTLDNVVVTCAPCNFGRTELTLDEVGLLDPRLSRPSNLWDGAAKWNGLQEFV